MASCCEDKSCEVSALRESHGRVLWTVLFINATMFVFEGGAGLLAHSTSLLADALDMLGDALVYGFSLFVLARSARWLAGAALMKGSFMLLFGLGVLAEAVYKILHPSHAWCGNNGRGGRNRLDRKSDLLLFAVPPSCRQPEYVFDLALFEK